MTEVTLVTLLLAGLLGSTHCVAMCGGIATALGSAASPAPRHGATAWLMHFGRISSYGIAGAVAGAAGAAGMSLATTRWNEALRLATAAMIMLIGLRIATGGRLPWRWLRVPERAGAVLWRRVAPVANRMLPKSRGMRAIAVGMLWGWLPCGLVYSAMLAAAVAGSAVAGAASMLAFGSGTLPAMLGIGALARGLPRAGGSAARLLGSIMVACGLWTASTPVATLAGLHHHAHHMAVMESTDPTR